MSIRSQELASTISPAPADELSQVTDPGRRAALEDAVRNLKYEQATVPASGAAGSGSRRRVISNVAARRVAMVRNMISRLEQLIKR